MAMQPANDGDEEEEAAGAVLEDAFIDFRDAGLRLPPVPRELVAELDEFADWRWGSEDVDLMDAATLLDAAREPGGEPMVAFGHVGHGVNSWFLCYALRLPALSVYLRLGYGGAYMDNAAAVASFNAASAGLEPLIPAAEAAMRAGRLGDGRLLVVLDAIGESGWQVTGGGEGWMAAEEPLEAAMERLSAPLPEEDEQPEEEAG